jgi:hypothetical protein
MSAEPQTTTPAAREPWPLDRPVPAIVFDADLMAIIGLKHSQYCVKKAAGEFRFLEMRPQLSGNTQYSGLLITRWLRAELPEAGQVRAFFGKAKDRRGRRPERVK